MTELTPELREQFEQMARDELVAMKAFIATLGLDAADQAIAFDIARHTRNRVFAAALEAADGITTAERWNVGVCAVAAILHVTKESKYPALADSVRCDCDECRRRKEKAHAR